MSSLQRTITRVLAESPKQALEQLLRPKLKQEGVKSYRRGAAALAEYLLKPDRGEFHWEDPFDRGSGAKVELTFAEEDLSKLEKVADLLGNVERLSQIIEKLLAEASLRILKNYRSQWHQFRRQEDRVRSNFQNNIEMRWGEALDSLRILLDLCIDEGSKYRQRAAKSSLATPQYRRIALLKLHARSCQVAAEILCLMENGYANGAIARWRTLYEIEVIATIISEGGNRLAERYLDHEVIDNRRGADLYQRNCASEGTKPITNSEMKVIRREYDGVIARYGSDFASHYGWAAEYLKNRSPRFVHLENAASGARMRSGYKFASYNVHASASSFRHNLSDLRGEGLSSAGASNAGLAQPGHLTAVSLLRITYLLIENLRALEVIALVNSLITLREETITAFWEADSVLRHDDAAIRAAGAEHGVEIDTSYI